MKLKYIAVLLLLLDTAAATTIQLGGPSGLAILENLNASSHLAAMVQPSGLWGWGSMPPGHVLQNGSLAEGTIVNVEIASMESPMQAAGLNDFVEAGSSPQIGGAAPQGNSQGSPNWPQMTVSTPVSHSGSGFFDATSAPFPNCNP